MIVIPGHGAVGGKADLMLFRDVMVDLREKVAALKKHGRSLAEVVAAKPSARTDEEWGNGFMTQLYFSSGCTRAGETQGWPSVFTISETN